MQNSTISLNVSILLHHSIIHWHEYTALLGFLKAEQYPFLWMISIGFNCSHIDGNVNRCQQCCSGRTPYLLILLRCFPLDKSLELELKIINIWVFGCIQFIYFQNKTFNFNSQQESIKISISIQVYQNKKLSTIWK